MQPLQLKMKNDLPSLENSEQLMWPTSEILAGAGHVVRCYECSFCKRGFSNAQALGGHMNIHRRDRAKLKLNSHEKDDDDDDDDDRLLSLDPITNSNPFPDSLTDQNQVSLDMITKINPLINVPAAEFNKPGEIDQSSSTDQEKLCTTLNKRPWIIPKKLDDSTRSDKAHASGEVLLQQQRSSSIIHDDLKNLSRMGHKNDGTAMLEVLDLELRLGHEPQHYCPSTTSG